MSWEVWGMISNKSFFNGAIFKNNLKRFKWGSILYGIALFFAVPFMLFITNYEMLLRRYPIDGSGAPILFSDYIIIPALLAIAIPTVAAVLIFNNVHSIRQSIFVHSLPPTRRENYVSDVLSGLVMMALPVIANGIILLIMSFSKYGELMTISSVIYWIFLNLSIIFVMFSVSTATAFLTGNAAVHIGLNAFVHVLPLLVALLVAVISEKFLYGFMVSDNFVANKIMENTPLVWLFAKAINYRAEALMFKSIMFWVFIVMSTGIYLAGYALYRVRKMELAGDVCAFEVFKPIFKYTITAAVSIIVFSILVETGIADGFAYFETAVAAAIAYFICEMLINKSFRVFHKYKGLLVFFAVAAAILLFVANTSVFGFETRVPEFSEVESAAVHESYRYDNILVSDDKLISDVIEIHGKVTENIPRKVERVYEDGRSFYVTYKLKNGKILRRNYIVDADTYYGALSKMYENTEYKMKITCFDELNTENVKRVELRLDSASTIYNAICEGDEARELIAALEKDIKALSYTEMSRGDSLLSLRVEVNCTYEENARLHIFKQSEDEKELMQMMPEDYKYMMRTFGITINKNFKNTFEVLKRTGHYDELLTQASKAVWICKTPVMCIDGVYTFNGETKNEDDFIISGEDCVQLYSVDGRQVVEDMVYKNRSKAQNGNNYFVFLYSGAPFKEKMRPYDSLVINEKDIPEYLKKYLNSDINL